MAESTQPNQEIESGAVEPREPETEKGRLVREQYLSSARAILGEPKLSYADLYQRYSGSASEVQQAAQSLDEAIAKAALNVGNAPRMVIQLLAQGPFTQRQTCNLSPEGRQAALPKLLQYAQATVEGVQQQRFVDYANVITGKVWNYPDLYRTHIGSDLAAIQLDQKVTAAALQAGESAESVAALLQQGPYGRFQRDVKQVKSGMIEQYARGTVAQVQEIQALRPFGVEKLQQRSHNLER